jgi:hypothetical protein
MKCKLCNKVLNRERDKCFASANFIICEDCGNSLVVSLFGTDEFNMWLDSFLQSRIEKYIPEYNEYFERHNKQRCLTCSGTGFVNKKPCSFCGFTGEIDLEQI